MNKHLKLSATACMALICSPGLGSYLRCTSRHLTAFSTRVRGTRYSQSAFVGLGSILKLPEVKAQIAEGDLFVEDLESAWLEACAVKVRS